MILIVCLDTKNGLQFNKRRQSRDSRVIERIYDITDRAILFINENSKPLFPIPRPNLIVRPNPIECAKSQDYCFIEENVVANNDNIDKIIVFRWDKQYPKDEEFNINLSDWKLISTTEFKGSSHKLIIEETYVKWEKE